MASKKEKEVQTMEPAKKEVAESEAEQIAKAEATDIQGETSERPQLEEITIKFGKGLLGDPFMGKDGNEYRSVLIPNSDPEDHRPWASFVVRANRVHEDKFGKGMWIKLPAEGYTTIKRGEVVGKDEAGKSIWEDKFTKVANRELKTMVEFYKERPRESVKGKLAEKQAEVDQAKEKTGPKLDKAKAQEQAI